MKDKLPKAQSRSEVLLHAIINGDKTNLPEPQSRIEVLLREIAEIGLKGEDTAGNEEFFGVRFESSNPIGTRLGLASGLSASVGVDDKVVMNDFDSKFPWSHIRRCNLSNDGQVLAYEGEPGYAADGSNGQVMVEIPKFYQYRYQSDDGEMEEYFKNKKELTDYSEL